MSVVGIIAVVGIVARRILARCITGVVRKISTGLKIRAEEFASEYSQLLWFWIIV